MAIFEGAGVALVTPMNENLEVNYDKLEELLEEQIAGGTDAIVICGTTGESATLTEEEHMRTIRFAIDKVNHRIPVVAGTGSNSTATATQMSKEAAEAGADGILLVTPYYNKGTQNGLIKHYTTITEEAKVPAILYNVPSRTGCSLAASTVAYLAKTAHISEAYFRRLFKAEYNTSPKKYISKLRIKYASELIATGYYSLPQVAEMSGFSDYRYFSVEFKRHMGCSPSKYRYVGVPFER